MRLLVADTTKEDEADGTAREIEGPVPAHSTPGEPRHHGWRWRTASVLSGVLIFTLISLWAYSPFWELALRSDNAPVAWLSSALLFACAAQAWASMAQHKLAHGRAGVLVVALVAMALDEQFGFHEDRKHRCAEWTSWCARATPGQVHWLGDAPMVMVAVAGVLVLMTLHRDVASRIVRSHLAAAVLVGVVLALGTHFGHLGGVLPAHIGRLEEVFEVLAEALFLCALVELNALPRLQRQVQSSS
ncbi:MAG: hypothetical protein MUF08_03745 [Burkholderiaceae bacterium]|jgi:hypothetical protein|nr:hypothetical protein [Burkholderiaceae bacterium]